MELRYFSLKYRGSGKVKVKMNGTCAGEITLTDNKDVTNITNQEEYCMEAGEYELKLEIVEADKLETIEIMLGIIRRTKRGLIFIKVFHRIANKKEELSTRNTLRMYR